MRDSFNLSLLQQQLDAHLRHAEAAGQDNALFSVTLSAAQLQLRGLPPLAMPYVYSASPERELRRLGLGQAWRTEVSGGQRFDELTATLQQLRARWVTCGDQAHTGRMMFCTQAFDPDDAMTGPWADLPNSLLLVPRVLLCSHPAHTTLTFTCRGDERHNPEAVLHQWLHLARQLNDSVDAAPACDSIKASLQLERSPESGQEWTRLVERALSDIASGHIEKVVVARSIRVDCGQPLSAPALLATLEQLYPSCQLLAINSADSTVVSATPERLATTHDGSIHCDALGGTGPRAADPHQDQSLALRLLNSHKTRYEHALVVDAIENALRPLCNELDAGAEPAVVKLRNLQHLWTGIKGRLREGVTLLQAAQQLHPTPAVAGTPRDAACQWLAQHESLQRGWYSGLAGWLQADGNGELSVLLRCAVLRGASAHLFAGAGIVAGSDPQAELLETEIKLHAMLEAISQTMRPAQLPPTMPGSQQRASQ